MSLLTLGIIALAVIFVAALLYFAYSEIKPRVHDEIPKIDVLFAMNKKQVSELKERLDDYIKLHGAQDTLFYPEQTFGAFLHKLELEYHMYLARDTHHYRKKKIQHSEIDVICHKMEAQFHELLQLKREVDLKLK